MKLRNFIIATLISTITLGLTSCEELIGTCTASINGTTWKADIIGGVKTGNRYTITGKSGNSTLVINIGGTTAGTYDMSLIEGSIQAFVYTPDVTAPTLSYVGSTGSIVVTKVESNRLSGTFNVSATSTQDVNDIITITGEFTNVLSN